MIIQKIFALADIRERFYSALIDKDEARVLSTLHSCFLFTHADARVQNADDFINQFIKNDQVSIIDIFRHDRQMAVFEETARITTICVIEMRVKGDRVKQHECFTEIYIKQDELWQLLTIHATFVT